MKKIKILPAGRPARKAVQCRTNTPQCILVVEDDVDIRRLNTDVLRESGYHVDDAPDGKVAWHALNNNHYDLLITDNNLPLMTGLELITALRAKDMKLPVILMSGTLPTEELKRHPWMKIQATLLKPYTLAELFLMVKKVLDESAHVREPRHVPANWQSKTVSDGLRP